MRSVHPNLNVLSDLGEYLNKKVLFISERTADRSVYYNWVPGAGLRQIIFQGIRAIEMAAVILKKADDHDIIFIYEHKPWFSIFIYLACVFKGKPTFFFIHGIQQTYRLSFIRTIGFKTLLYFERRYKFWPVHLEKSDEQFTDCLKFSKSSIVIPHPIHKQSQAGRTQKEKNSVLRVGIAGMIRQDKPIMQILEILKKYTTGHQPLEFAIGTPGRQVSEALKAMGIELVDTTTQVQYSSFLKSLDILVGFYEKESFYYRCSGVLNDAASAGCFIVVPDYPVLSQQISYPVKVGETYSGIDDLENALDRSIAYLSVNSIDFEAWRKSRYDDAILKCLSEQIRSVLEI